MPIIDLQAIGRALLDRDELDCKLKNVSLIKINSPIGSWYIARSDLIQIL